MIFLVRLARGILPLMGMLIFLTGCPQPETASDEEKEPHFMDGKRCANSMDYAGAVEQFEKALEVNPRNASAHFELGVLYDQRQPDPAAAIYHYQSYLKLKPKGAQAELATTHILACKQQLARTVSLGPVTATLEAEFQKLNDQSKRLTQENMVLRDEVDKWKNLAGRLQSLTNQLVAASSTARPGPDPLIPEPARTDSTTHPVQSVASRPSPTIPPPTRTVTPVPHTKRTHVVKHGETFATIARQYGVRVDALMGANPRIDARHLRVGQTLNVP